MSENMVERVAKAIHEAYWADEWDKTSGIERAATIQQAVAAIEAMREPTETMIFPGYDALMEWDARTGEDNGIADIWSAMIDAALSTPKAAGTPE